MRAKIARAAGHLLRVCLVAWLLFACMRDWPEIALRGEIDHLPDFNYLAAADSLRIQNRFSEALLVDETGYLFAPAQIQSQLQDEHAQIEADRDNLLRRVREAGYGAATGQPGSNDALAGADFMAVGDFRDLAYQGHAARSGTADEAVAALTAAESGVPLTPETDWGIAVLKFTAHAGALTENFDSSLAKLARRTAQTRSKDGLDKLIQAGKDVAQLSRNAKPAAAIGILRHLDNPEMLHQAALFSSLPGGAFTLWLGEGEAAQWLVRDLGSDNWLLRAGRKGRAGIDQLAAGGNVTTGPHFLREIVNAFYDGAVPPPLDSLIAQYAEAITGMIGGWLLCELALLFAAFAPAPRRI